mgnify:CR=1 FL=1
MNHFRRAILTVISVSIVASALTGCGSSAAPEIDPSCPDSRAALSALEIVADVRTATGPSTACLASNGVVAVADTTSPALPVTITDAEGTEVTVTDASRILPIDISGTIAATVFALGLGDSVVGRDSSTDLAGTEDLPVVTNAGHTLNTEAILKLAPTVVLTDTTLGPKEVRQQLRDAGIAVVVVSDDRRLDTTDDLIAEIAAALGVPSRGEALMEQADADLAAAREQIAQVAPTAGGDRARMLFLYVRGNANIYYIFGADSGADSLIEAVGGIDVASEIGWGGMKPMTAEALVAAPRAAYGYNSISAAIDYSVHKIETNDIDSLRRVIDVSGDGPNIGGRPVTAARDDAVGRGIVINALLISRPGGLSMAMPAPQLRLHYERDVTGGPGAFVMVADATTTFADAVRRKMILEIAALEDPGRAGRQASLP